MDYDIMIVGAGPGGIFTAYELRQLDKDIKIAVFECGNPLDKRKCPIDGDKIKSCINCKTCAIMNGFGGAGAFSDGKYNITNEFGGNLYEYIGREKALELMRYVDGINLSHGGEGTKLYSTANTAIKKKCFENDLHLLSPEDRKRAKQYMKLKSGYSLWKISGFFTEVMFRLPAVRQSEMHSRNGGKVFMYYWKKRSHLPHLRACHAVELSYVFGNIQDTIYTGKPADPALSRQVQDQWVRFAETGDPGTPELPWPAYDEKDRWTMILKEHSEAVKDPLPEQRTVLDPILDYRLNASYANMNFNVPFVWKSAGKVLLILLLIAVVLFLILK